MPLFGLNHYGAYTLLVGALMFGSMQILARYDGHNVTVKRLRRQMVLGALLLIVSGLLAVGHDLALYHIGSGEWKLCLAIATVMEIYSSFRLPNALNESGESA